MLYLGAVRNRSGGLGQGALGVHHASTGLSPAQAPGRDYGHVLRSLSILLVSA